MKCRSIFFLLVFAFASTVSAKVVSQTEALQVATAFFNSGNGVQTLSGTLALKEIWNSNRLSQGELSLLSNETPTFYVFAPETGKGFVVVSAEDAVTPILGYSFEDEAPEGELPCNLRLWFEATHNHISETRAEGTTATEETLQQWARASVGSSVLLLETAKWAQESPYNQQCPMDGNNRSVTGCVSTATAIVMRYYQYPDRGTGVTDAYTTSSRGIYVDSRSLEHEYNWSVMPLEDMSGNYTDEQAYAVSTLMADIGYLLQADYTSDETGTTTSGKQNVKLYEHFDYSPSMYWLDCEEFYSKEWHDILKDEMNSHGPVIYSSFGHMFILDGYTDDEYFHINWGWGGYSNGYFLLSDLEELEDNRALANFYPHDGSEPESTLRMCVPGMVANTENFASGESFLITDVYIESASTIEFSGSMRFALADKDGNIKEWISNSRSLSLSPGYSTHITNISCTIKEAIKAGDRIRLFYQDSGAEEWKLLTSNTSKCQWEIVIEVYADLDVPETKEASDVDAQGRTFTAHWTAVEGAVGYQVMLTQIVPKDNPWDHTLIEESFDKCYSSALNTGNDISNNIDSYLSSTGWTGQYLYTSPDYLHIGNGNDEGYVQTPLLDAPSESAATVYLNYSFGSGGTDVIKIEILDKRGAGESMTRTHTHSQASEYTYILRVLNWSSEMYVGIYSTNVNLSGLYVFDGNYSEDDFELDQSNDIESTYYTTDTSYTFTELENAEYTYKVRAFSAAGSSDWSNTISVDMTFEEVDAVSDVNAYLKEVARYTMDGRKVNVQKKGINIVRFSDGTARKVLVK